VVEEENESSLSSSGRNQAEGTGSGYVFEITHGRTGGTYKGDYAFIRSQTGQSVVVWLVSAKKYATIHYWSIGVLAYMKFSTRKQDLEMGVEM